MALVLLLLLSGTQGHPEAVLEGRPGDLVNLSCVGVSHPIRWAWAPTFPACKGLSKGRRPILWASSSGTSTVPPSQLFAGRLRALDPDIRHLELLLSAGDSGMFFCKGHQKNESRTLLRVLQDGPDCRAPELPGGPENPQFLIPLLTAGFALGLGLLGVAWWLRRPSSPHQPRPLSRFAPFLKAYPQRPVMKEESKLPRDTDQERARSMQSWTIRP